MVENSSNLRIKALSKVFDPTRIRILKTLLREETCVCKMVEVMGIRHSLLSHHLSVLVDLGYLLSDRQGNHILYRIVEAKRSEVRLIVKLEKEQI